MKAKAASTSTTSFIIPTTMTTWNAASTTTTTVPPSDHPQCTKDPPQPPLTITTLWVEGFHNDDMTMNKTFVNYFMNTLHFSPNSR